MAVVVALIAVWIHSTGDRILGESDSRKLVWDEVAGFLVAVIFIPFTWRIAVAAFLLERFFDVAKVWPASWIDRKVHGGWGVVGDDVVAGVYTVLALEIMRRTMPGLLGLPL